MKAKPLPLPIVKHTVLVDTTVPSTMFETGKDQELNGKEERKVFENSGTKFSKITADNVKDNRAEVVENRHHGTIAKRELDSSAHINFGAAESLEIPPDGDRACGLEISEKPKKKKKKMMERVADKNNESKTIASNGCETYSSRGQDRSSLTHQQVQDASVPSTTFETGHDQVPKGKGEGKVFENSATKFCEIIVDNVKDNRADGIDNMHHGTTAKKECDRACGLEIVEKLKKKKKKKVMDAVAVKDKEHSYTVTEEDHNKRKQARRVRVHGNN